MIRTRLTTRDGETPMEAAILPRLLMPRSGEPDEVASTIVYLASKDASYITGQVHAVDGGYAGSI